MSRTLLVVRRYLLSFVHARKAYKSSPEERRFEILGGEFKKTGPLVWTSMKWERSRHSRGRLHIVLLGGEASTPWGPAAFSEVQDTGAFSLGTSTHWVTCGVRDVAMVTDHLTRCDFVFPQAGTVSLRKHKEHSMKFDGDSSAMSVSQEEGSVLRTVDPTSSSYEPVSKESRPKHYKQWRVELSGTSPIDENDLALSLAMYLTFNHLMGGHLSSRYR